MELCRSDANNFSDVKQLLDGLTEEKRREVVNAIAEVRSIAKDRDVRIERCYERYCVLSMI